MTFQPWLTSSLTCTSHTQINFPSVLYSHHLGLNTSIPKFIWEPHTGCILPGPRCLKHIHSSWRKLRTHRTHLCLLWDRASYSIAGSFLYSFCSHCQKISFCCSSWVLFVSGRGGCIWFHWALIGFGLFLQPPPPSPASALLTPCFPHHTFSRASLAWHPSFHVVHTFLMYPLPSRHLHMLIITKADVLKYPCSRANIHKPLWDSWWVQVPTYASLVREPLWGC